MAKLRFPTRPPKDLAELHRWIAVDLLPQLERKVIYNVVVHRQETPVAHGLPSTPSYVTWAQHHLRKVCMSRQPDSQFVYLRATGDVVVDVEVTP